MCIRDRTSVAPRAGRPRSLHAACSSLKLSASTSSMTACRPRIAGRERCGTKASAALKSNQRCMRVARVFWQLSSCRSNSTDLKSTLQWTLALVAPKALVRVTQLMKLVCRCTSSATPAIDAAIYRPNGTSYQLQPSFHTSWTEPEPTARARRAGEEFY